PLRTRPRGGVAGRGPSPNSRTSQRSPRDRSFPGGRGASAPALGLRELSKPQQRVLDRYGVLAREPGQDEPERGSARVVEGLLHPGPAVREIAEFVPPALRARGLPDQAAALLELYDLVAHSVRDTEH